MYQKPLLQPLLLNSRRKNMEEFKAMIRENFDVAESHEIPCIRAFYSQKIEKGREEEEYEVVVFVDEQAQIFDRMKKILEEPNQRENEKMPKYNHMRHNLTATRAGNIESQVMRIKNGDWGSFGDKVHENWRNGVAMRLRFHDGTQLKLWIEGFKKFTDTHEVLVNHVKPEGTTKHKSTFETCFVKFRMHKKQDQTADFTIRRR